MKPAITILLGLAWVPANTVSTSVMRAMDGIDGFANAVSRELGQHVVIDESAMPDPLPDGLILMPTWDDLRVLTAGREAAAAASLSRRTMLFQVSGGDLDELADWPSVVGIVSNARYVVWQQALGRPLPLSVLVRRDLVTGVPPLEPRPQGRFPKSHVAVDPTGRAPLPEVIAAIARSWINATGDMVESER